jgi:DNA sulfur modification protein DndD
MKLLSLQMENWSSYKGSANTVSFATTPGSEITVVTAKNGFGKTSILKAFSFVLYGTVVPTIGRGSEAASLEDFPNRPALAGGQEITTAVSLKFEHQGVEWLLRREFSAKSSAGLVILGNVRKSLLRVGVGSGVPNDAIDDFINDNILNRQVSHFYFFDGVLLEEIQSQLTRKDEVSRNLVMRSVENALGLRFLDHLSQNLKSCLDVVDAGIIAQEKALNKNVSLLKLISDESERLEAYDKDLERILELKQIQVEKRDEHDARLMSINPDTKQKALERTTLQVRLMEYNDELAKAKEVVRACGEKAWLGPLEGVLTTMFEEREAAEEVDKAARRRYNIIERKVLDLRVSAEQKSCQLCGQDHDPAKIRKIEDEIADLEGQLGEFTISKEPEMGSIFKLGKAVTESKRVEALRSAFQAEDDILVRIAGAARKISKINDELGDFQVDINIKLEEANRAEADSYVRKYQGQYDCEKEERDLLALSLNANRSKLTTNSSVSQKDRDTRDLLDTLRNAIEDSFDNFRDQMRGQVEMKATEYLRVLTSEPDVYDSVEITSDYQIKIKSPSGVTLQIANSAHKQILTTAFVSAMASVSTETTPFVLDTAFGFLDSDNSGRLLHWAKYVNQQVVFLVNPKELPQELAQNILGSAIGREYEIVKTEPEVNELKEITA